MNTSFQLPGGSRANRNAPPNRFVPLVSRLVVIGLILAVAGWRGPGQARAAQTEAVQAISCAAGLKRHAAERLTGLLSRFEIEQMLAPAEAARLAQADPDAPLAAAQQENIAWGRIQQACDARPDEYWSSEDGISGSVHVSNDGDCTMTMITAYVDKNGAERVNRKTVKPGQDKSFTTKTGLLKSLTIECAEQEVGRCVGGWAVSAP